MRRPETLAIYLPGSYPTAFWPINADQSTRRYLDRSFKDAGSSALHKRLRTKLARASTDARALIRTFCPAWKLTQVYEWFISNPRATLRKIARAARGTLTAPQRRALANLLWSILTWDMLSTVPIKLYDLNKPLHPCTPAPLTISRKRSRAVASTGAVGTPALAG